MSGGRRRGRQSADRGAQFVHQIVLATLGSGRSIGHRADHRRSSGIAVREVHARTIGRSRREQPKSDEGAFGNRACGCTDHGYGRIRLKCGRDRQGSVRVEDSDRNRLADAVVGEVDDGRLGHNARRCLGRVGTGRRSDLIRGHVGPASVGQSRHRDRNAPRWTGGIGRVRGGKTHAGENRQRIGGTRWRGRRVQNGQRCGHWIGDIEAVSCDVVQHEVRPRSNRCGPDHRIRRRVDRGHDSGALVEHVDPGIIRARNNPGGRIPGGARRRCDHRIDRVVHGIDAHHGTVHRGDAGAEVRYVELLSIGHLGERNRTRPNWNGVVYRIVVGRNDGYRVVPRIGHINRAVLGGLYEVRARSCGQSQGENRRDARRTVKRNRVL